MDKFELSMLKWQDLLELCWSSYNFI